MPSLLPGGTELCKFQKITLFQLITGFILYKENKDQRWGVGFILLKKSNQLSPRK